MDGCLPDQTWWGLTSKCFCGTCSILRPCWLSCWGSTRKYIQGSPFRVTVAMIGFLQGTLWDMRKDFLWTDCRFYFNKLYTLYEMLVLQLRRVAISIPFHDWWCSLMIWFCMFCYVHSHLLLRLLLRFLTTIPTHQHNDSCTWLNPGSWTMTTTGAWTDFFLLFLRHWECMYRSSHGGIPVCPPRTWRNSVPEFPSGVSSSHLPQPLTSHDTQFSPLNTPWLSELIIKNTHEIKGSGVSVYQWFITYHSWRVMATQNQLHKVQLYGCQWRWTSPFRWILQMGRLEETESQLKFLAKKSCSFLCQLCLILTSFFWSFP